MNCTEPGCLRPAIYRYSWHWQPPLTEACCSDHLCVVQTRAVQLAAPMPAMSTIGSEDVEDVLTENRMFVAAINDLDRRLEASERGREELLRELGAYREHAQQLRLLAAQAEGLPPEHTEPELTEPAPAPPFDPEDLFANPEDDRAVPVPTPRDV